MRRTWSAGAIQRMFRLAVEAPQPRYWRERRRPSKKNPETCSSPRCPRAFQSCWSPRSRLPRPRAKPRRCGPSASHRLPAAARYGSQIHLLRRVIVELWRPRCSRRSCGEKASVSWRSARNRPPIRSLSSTLRRPRSSSIASSARSCTSCRKMNFRRATNDDPCVRRRRADMTPGRECIDPRRPGHAPTEHRTVLSLDSAAPQRRGADARALPAYDGAYPASAK